MVPGHGLESKEPSERGITTVAKGRISLLHVLRKAGLEGDLDFLKQVAQILIEHEVDEVVGAGPYERSAARSNYRNGYRYWEWEPGWGTLELHLTAPTTVAPPAQLGGREPDDGALWLGNATFYNVAGAETQKQEFHPAAANS